MAKKSELTDYLYCSKCKGTTRHSLSGGKETMHRLETCLNCSTIKTVHRLRPLYSKGRLIEGADPFEGWTL